MCITNKHNHLWIFLFIFICICSQNNNIAFVTVRNVSTDSHGFFNIDNKIGNYIKNGYIIISGFAKNSDGSKCLCPIFSPDVSTGQINAFGYLYITSGQAVSVVSSESNITIIVILAKAFALN